VLIYRPARADARKGKKVGAGKVVLGGGRNAIWLWAGDKVRVSTNGPKLDLISQPLTSGSPKPHPRGAGCDCDAIGSANQGADGQSAGSA
jgi:hypothetical protein